MVVMNKSNHTLPPFAIEEYTHRAEDFARREPEKAIASAFGVGVLLNVLPLGAIASVAVSASFALVRPALLFLGLLKAVEFCSAKKLNT